MQYFPLDYSGVTIKPHNCAYVHYLTKSAQVPSQNCCLFLLVVLFCCLFHYILCQLFCHFLWSFSQQLCHFCVSLGQFCVYHLPLFCCYSSASGHFVPLPGSCVVFLAQEPESSRGPMENANANLQRNRKTVMHACNCIA